MARLILSKARPAAPWAAKRAGDDYGAPAKPDWREIEWRQYLHQREINGRTLNYVDYGSGDGAPVVFIHGLGGCWETWLENIPRIGKTRRVIGVDLPGFGFSEMPPDKISIPSYGRCIEQLCEQLELGKVVLVGNSMGGFTGAEVAIQYPERVERLVLVSAAGISITELRRAPVLVGSRLVAAIGTRTAAAANNIVVRPRLRPFVYGTFIRHPTRIPTDLLYEITNGAGRKGFVGAMHALTDYDFTDRLPEIGCPTLIVWGAEDMLVPVSDADEFERLIPNARKVVFDDTGHTAMIERPSTFNDCLVEFLSEEPVEEAPEKTAATAS